MGLVRKVERIRYLRSIYLWSWEISGVLNQIVFISVLIEKRQLPFIFRRPFYIRTYMYRYLHLEHTYMCIVILFSPESVCCCCLMSRLAQQALRWCKSDPVQSRPREWAVWSPASPVKDPGCCCVAIFTSTASPYSLFHKVTGVPAHRHAHIHKWIPFKYLFFKLCECVWI